MAKLNGIKRAKQKNKIKNINDGSELQPKKKKKHGKNQSRHLKAEGIAKVVGKQSKDQGS